MYSIRDETRFIGPLYKIAMENTKNEKNYVAYYELVMSFLQYRKDKCS